MLLIVYQLNSNEMDGIDDNFGKISWSLSMELNVIHVRMEIEDLMRLIDLLHSESSSMELKDDNK